jgi:hypothetical protein
MCDPELRTRLRQPEGAVQMIESKFDVPAPSRERRHLMSARREVDRSEVTIDGSVHRHRHRGTLPAALPRLVGGGRFSGLRRQFLRRRRILAPRPPSSPPSCGQRQHTPKGHDDEMRERHNFSVRDGNTAYRAPKNDAATRPRPSLCVVIAEGNK